jgi:hypothetical protein
MPPRPSQWLPSRMIASPACMVRPSGVGGFGGGSLERPRHWLGVRCTGGAPLRVSRVGQIRKVRAML